MLSKLILSQSTHAHTQQKQQQQIRAQKLHNTATPPCLRNLPISGVDITHAYANIQPGFSPGTEGMDRFHPKLDMLWLPNPCEPSANKRSKSLRQGAPNSQGLESSIFSWASASASRSPKSFWLTPMKKLHAKFRIFPRPLKCPNRFVGS